MYFQVLQKLFRVNGWIPQMIGSEFIPSVWCQKIHKFQRCYCELVELMVTSGRSQMLEARNFVSHTQ